MKSKIKFFVKIIVYIFRFKLTNFDPTEKFFFRILSTVLLTQDPTLDEFLTRLNFLKFPFAKIVNSIVMKIVTWIVTKIASKIRTKIVT